MRSGDPPEPNFSYTALPFSPCRTYTWLRSGGLSPQFWGRAIPDSSSLGKLVLYHLPLFPESIFAEASPIHRHSCVCKPLLGSEEPDLRRPQRQEAVSMKDGTTAEWLVEVDIMDMKVLVEIVSIDEY